VDFRAGAARLGQADGDRLLAAGHFLARAPAAQSAALALAHDLPDLACAFLPYFLAMKNSYSIFAFALALISSSILFCTSICWMRGRTRQRGELGGRTSSSWMMW
jgi:hypothetical protein